MGKLGHRKVKRRTPVHTWDLGEAPSPFWASGSLSTKWGDEEYPTLGLGKDTRNVTWPYLLLSSSNKKTAHKRDHTHSPILPANAQSIPEALSARSVQHPESMKRSSRGMFPSQNSTPPCKQAPNGTCKR